MPQLGESVVEGTIAKWLVGEGDAVVEDQPLVEVTTDKIDTEIPSPAAGVVGRILVPEGATVEIGAVLCEIAEAGVGAAAGPAAAQPAGSTAAASPPGAAPAPARPRTPAAPPPRFERPAGPSPEPPAQTAARAGAGARPPSDGEPSRAAPAAAPPARPAPPGAAARAEGATARRSSARARPGVALDEARVAGARERRAVRTGDGNGGPGGERRITPVVRRMAAEHDLDLSEIPGTGVGGRVTKDDVLRHLAAAGMDAAPPVEAYGDELGVESEAMALPPAPRASAKAERLAAPPRAERSDGASAAAPGRPGLELREYTPPAVEPAEGDRVEPFSKRRKIIAEHMVWSKAVSPHVYTMAEIDMGRVSALRDAKKRAFRDAEGVNLTFLHFVIAATVRALRDVPQMNAAVSGDSLVLRRDVHVGVAVDTEGGLVVPVVRNADRLSLRGIAREVEALGARARERKLRLEDLQGGTFTVSNPGREGNLVGFAVINQPQLGILRMGEIRKRAVVLEVDGSDTIAIRPVMLMSLSYDHRVIDGVTGNRFLYRIREILEAGEFEV
jgi:2-oxoglutarate dehydrogenase E2 component (dihydrolipoamide succinyltransferase)